MRTPRVERGVLFFGDGLDTCFLMVGPTAERAPQRIGANPAPNAVNIRVVRLFTPRLTSGKSPTGL